MSQVQFLRPSGAATWMTCAGYVAMRALFPDAPDEADTEIQEDGTACHWLASELHAGRFHAEGSLAPNGRELTEEMFDACDEYLGVINGWPGVAPVVEQSIPGDVIFPGMSGTPDAWAYDPSNRILYVADLKFGFRFVEVFENWQLLCYVLMLIDLLKINGLLDQHLTVKMTIVQPRSTHRDGPVRTWSVRASDLRGLFNQLIHAAHQAMLGGPCVPNPYCGDCPARHACTALQDSGYAAVERAYASVPHELTPTAVGGELRMLKDAQKRLEARITGLETQAEHLLTSGQVVPGWGLEPSFARERWRDEAAESQVLTLALYFNNAPLAKPRRAITPKQARKYLPEDVVLQFSHRPSTGVRLTQIDSKSIRKKFTT